MQTSFSTSDGRDRPLLRVAQWATGNIGLRALRHVIEHPDLDLVALHVYSDDKVGQDAGVLCGLAPVGVLATRDIEAVIAAEPDCVLYMPRTTDIDDVCRLLDSGSNVVSTAGAFHHPASMDSGVRSRVDGACTAGRASIHSTGSSPGFITEALPLVLTSIQRRLDRLSVFEFADLSSRDSPELLFGLMGFGKAPTAFDPGRLAHAEAGFGPSLRIVADALGTPLDGIEASGEIAVATRTVEIAAGIIEAGTVAGQRTIVSGIRNGLELVRFVATWFCSQELEPRWDLLSTGWRVSVEGDAPLELDIRLPIPPERMASVTPGYTANRAVNAIPMVCAAQPGIRTIMDLAPVVAHLR